MFENLSEKLQRAFKNLRGQGTITEENIQEALREIRVALLEADVNLNVVRELIEHIRVKAIGQEVMTALSPSEQVVKIVHDELVTLLGKDTAGFRQNHNLGQAGGVAAKGRTPAHAGFRRRLSSGGP
jgi:signal recognition particle subunit SRP54